MSGWRPSPSGSLPARTSLPSLPVDAVVALGDLDWALVEQLRQLEPCGYANPQPVFASRGLEVLSARLVGSDGKHLKLAVRDPEDAHQHGSHRVPDG